MLHCIYRRRHGILHLPLALLLSVLVFGGIGTWEILESWRRVAGTQLRLDRCTAKTALLLRNTLERIEVSNARIQKLRASIWVAQAFPETLPPLRIALQAEVSRQDVLRFRWEAESVQWLAQLKCGDYRDRLHPLPQLLWFREPPDFLGPKPLTWPGEMPHEFKIRAFHSPRSSQARAFHTSKWEAAWFLE